jgi:two-component system NtrC family sensor kinase
MLNKIGLKLILAISLCVIIIISFFAYTNIEYQNEMLTEEIVRHSLQCSETIQNSILYEMTHSENEHLYSIMDRISHQKGFCRIRVINKEGSVVFSSDSSLLGDTINKQSKSCLPCHLTKEASNEITIEKQIRFFKTHADSSRKLAVIKPIFNSPKCYESTCHVHSKNQQILGILDVTVSLKDVDNKIENAKMHLLWYTLITIFALSGVVWLLVRKWIDAPVSQLVSATNHIAAGNFNYTIESGGKDELSALAHSFNNMTKQLKEVRQQVYQSEKMASMGRLAAGVAHEINNPLTGILTYSSFLQKRAKDQPELQEDLAVIVRETKRSREIVKGLLDFARQSAPKKNKDNVNAVIKRTLKVLENSLKIKQTKIVLDLDNDLPDIILDSNQMQQVFMNLIDNASQAFSTPGGAISITTKQEHLSPYGISSVKNAFCPKGHSLMDHDVKIEGFSSVKVAAKVDGKWGTINLDPIYGANRNQYGVEYGKKNTVSISCTKCNSSLIHEEKLCPKCNSPLYFFETPGRGQFEGCARISCDYQYWEVVEAEGKKNYIEIKIEDDAVGMKADVLNKIFEPFFSTKGQKGTGLGLAVVWGIIDKHEGKITVHSEEGKGTIFKIFLPA